MSGRRGAFAVENLEMSGIAMEWVIHRVIVEDFPDLGFTGFYTFVDEVHGHHARNTEKRRAGLRKLSLIPSEGVFTPWINSGSPSSFRVST